MELWRIVLILSGIVVLSGFFYCLHFLLLRWESKGYIYYLKNKAGSGGTTCLMELQKIVEPQVVHVYELKTEQPGIADRERDGTTDTAVP